MYYRKCKKACVEPRTSVLNMTLPAAAARAPTVQILTDDWYAAPTAVTRYLLVVPAPELSSKPAASDKRMERPDRYTDRALHNIRRAIIWNTTDILEL